MLALDHPLLSEPIERRRIIALSSATVLAFSANIGALIYGISIVLPHLLYLPILLAGYWYPRRGPAIAILIAVLYAIIAILLTTPDLFITVSILARAAVYIIIGVIVSLLTVRLRRSEQQLYDLIEFLPDATFAIDREGQVIAWNRAIEEMTGIPKMKMIGRGEYAYAEAFYGEARPILINHAMENIMASESYYPEIKRSGDTIETEVFAPHLNDKKGAHLKITATPLYDPGGDITGAVESIRDITEEVLTRTALQNSNRQLATLSGIIRHGLSERLEELYRHLTIGSMQFTDPDVLTFLEKIERSAEGIRRQIAISRDFREIGSRPPLWIPVQEAVMGAASRLDTAGMTIRTWTERLQIFSDPSFGTACSHLIENAHAAGATALVITYQIRDDGCTVYFEDNGIGVSEEKKETLFSQSREQSGHGLFLTQEILAITGICISEEGTSGLGARFALLVPPEGYRIT